MTREVRLRPAAERDLERLTAFVVRMDERAGLKRAKALREAVRKLGARPFVGRPAAKPNTRDHTIRFGRSSYLIRYQVTDDAVIIFRIWHGKQPCEIGANLPRQFRTARVGAGIGRTVRRLRTSGEREGGEEQCAHTHPSTLANLNRGVTRAAP